jgi:hypothetical protein
VRVVPPIGKKHHEQRYADPYFEADRHFLSIQTSLLRGTTARLGPSMAAVQWQEDSDGEANHTADL